MTTVRNQTHGAPASGERSTPCDPGCATPSTLTSVPILAVPGVTGAAWASIAPTICCSRTSAACIPVTNVTLDQHCRRADASLGSGSCAPSTPSRSIPTTRSRVSSSASDPTRRRRTGWTRVAGQGRQPQPSRPVEPARRRLSADRLPMILGCDAAGIDECTGDEVVVHAVVNADGWRGDDTTDPGRTLLSEKHQGSLADYVIVPERNVVPKPAELSWAEAACLSTAWLTAYRMLFTKSGLRPGQTVLVQGATGGVASACIAMARAAGFRVYATARTEDKQAARARARRARGVRVRCPAARAGRRGDGDRRRRDLVALGSSRSSPADGSWSPERHRAPTPPADLNRVFFLQLQVIGSTMGTKDELATLIAFLQRDRPAPAHRPHHPDGSRRPTGSRRWRPAISSARSSWSSELITAVVAAAFDRESEKAIAEQAAVVGVSAGRGVDEPCRRRRGEHVVDRDQRPRTSGRSGRSSRSAGTPWSAASA